MIELYPRKSAVLTFVLMFSASNVLAQPAGLVMSNDSHSLNKMLVGIVYGPAVGKPANEKPSDCDDGYPSKENIPNGKLFKKTFRCRQDIDVEQTVYDLWSDGSKTNRETKKYRVSQLVSIQQDATGTAASPIVGTFSGPVIGRMVSDSYAVCQYDTLEVVRCYQDFDIERVSYNLREDGTVDPYDAEYHRMKLLVAEYPVK